MSEEFDVIVLGAGPGGYVAAIRASQLNLKTLLIEKNQNLGGTCLNVGCIPSKTLLYYSEQMYADQNHRQKAGLEFSEMKMDLGKLMQTKAGVVKGLNMGIGSLLKKNKITHKVGHAKFLNANEIEVEGVGTFKSKHIIIATGSKARALPDLPFDEETVISSTGALSLKKVPKKMVVVGAGVIGLELGSVYQRLGAEVTFVEALDSIGGGLDPAISSALLKSLQKQGLNFHLKHQFVSAKKENGGYKVTIKSPSSENVELEADVVLVSIGRVPNTEGLNLEAAQITMNEKGMVQIDDQFQTTAKNVYAIGDVVDGPMLAHKASEEGVAVAEKIAGKAPTVNYLAIPNVIYTSPEIATVGFSKEEAQKHGLDVKVGSFPFLANSRAHCVDAKEGLVQVVVDAQTDQVVGVHIMSEHAGEMIAIGGLAITMKATAKTLGALCFPHPTFSEAIKEAALSVHKEAIHF